MKVAHATNKIFLALIFTFVISFSFSCWSQFHSGFSILEQRTSIQHNASLDSVSHIFNAHPLHEQSRWLRPGDLPGYTGWARPFHTLAGSFGPPLWLSNVPAEIAKNVTVRIECLPSTTRPFHTNHCQHGGSLFYIRAYGPAVLPGSIVDHQNGSYDVSVVPLDAGRYYLEVVLAYSAPPPLPSFPLAHEQEEPAYEGFLLPGFPLGFDVQPETGSNETALTRRICMASDLYSNGYSGENGRWIVKEKATSRQPSTTTTTMDGTITLDGYQKGINSLGVRMAYSPRYCSLLPFKAATDVFQCAKDKKVHVVYIGDSNIRMQKRLFDLYWKQAWPHLNSTLSDLSHIETSLISTSGGLHLMLRNVTLALDVLANEATNSTNEYMILFNSGLHDIAQRCARPKGHQKQALNGSCTEEYEESFRALVRVVAAFPARLKVFQTTTAGWPKFGNGGFGWPPDTPQTLPRDPNFVAHFNNVALNVLEAEQPSHHNIMVMEAFWLTLARPDHREVDKANSIGKHLVHAGPEVVNVLVRQWMTMIVGSACNLEQIMSQLN